MNNDDIKKYIDHSKLYTEVDLEKNQKVEEGIFDWFKEKLGLTDAENDKAVGDLIDNLDSDTKKQVDDAADKTLLTFLALRPGTYCAYASRVIKANNVSNFIIHTILVCLSYLPFLSSDF